MLKTEAYGKIKLSDNFSLTIYDVWSRGTQPPKFELSLIDKESNIFKNTYKTWWDIRAPSEARVQGMYVTNITF